MRWPKTWGWAAKGRGRMALALAAMGLAAGLAAGVGDSQAAGGFTWWPDGADAGTDARATWVYFDDEYAANWASAALIAASVAEMRDNQVDVVVVSLKPAEMTGLADPAAERTVAIQQLADRAREFGMAVYIAYWEDEFAGTAAQMSSYTAADSVMAFNAGNGLLADIVGVVTDYEMHGANRTAKRYEQWRQFHSQLKARIAPGGLKLLPSLTDPAALLNSCATCTAKWRRVNKISGADPDYQGDVAYFSAYGGVRFADGLIGLYYRGTAAAVTASAHDDLVEGAALKPAVPIVVAFSVGPNAADPSLLTRAEVAAAVAQNELEKAAYPLGTAGTLAWRWDDPQDGDAEYRGTW